MHVNSARNIDVIDLGRMSYENALSKQENAVSDIINNEGCSRVFLVEHEPVLTFGKNSDPRFLLFPLDFYKKQGVEIFTTERGGQVTAHMPGQLVVYPILDMTKLNLSVRKYVHILEESVINTLAKFGIEAHRDLDHPGVWVQHEKICAIGVRIKSRISMHGLALNVTNDLGLFGKIVPCGIQHRGVTNMMNLSDKQMVYSEVQKALVDELLRLLYLN